MSGRFRQACFFEHQYGVLQERVVRERQVILSRKVLFGEEAPDSARTKCSSIVDEPREC